MPILPFEWDQLDSIIQDAFALATVDPSKRWIVISNAPTVNQALQLANIIRSCCKCVFIGDSKAGIAVWIDILSWQLEDAD